VETKGVSYFNVRADIYAFRSRRTNRILLVAGAVNLMKKRKLYQSEAIKISNVKMTLETQAISLESATFTAKAYQASMSAGTNTMKKIRADTGIDQVDDMMMDIQEEMQMAETID
jgi:hypothetical protein